MDFVISDEKIPIKVWGEKPEVEYALITEGSVPIKAPHLLHEGVFEQARNLANIPCATKWVCLMPDYHLGYGMPIGGVLVTKNAVVPNAVGVDIGCGMIAVQTDLEAASLDSGLLQMWRTEVHRAVPVGKNRHDEPVPLSEELDFNILHPEGTKTIVRSNDATATSSLGTLGGGNHFIELQEDEDGLVWIMLHSGSRQMGLKVCNHYSKVAQKYMEAFGVKVGKDLAFLPREVPEHNQYIAEMQWCMKYAEESRKKMMGKSIIALTMIAPDNGFRLLDTVDTHHNFAAMEHHYGENVMVHRKGAVKATGLVTIPGSMGTASYIARGLEPEESFNTCAHGAGRVMSRKQANKTITREEAEAQMDTVVYGIRDGEFDEMPAAYKDIDKVMSHMQELVEPVHRLLPLAVVKG